MDAQEPCIIDDTCTLCGACVAACVEGALVLGDTKALVARPEVCDNCGTCEEVCPCGAIQCSFIIVWGPADQAEEGEHSA
jgi:MinD superfamily P-loop ATPase